MTLTQEERLLREKGFKTHRMVLEESFWHRFAYHVFREYGQASLSLCPAIDEGSGDFTVTCNTEKEEPIFRFSVPRDKVKQALFILKDHLPNQHGLAIHPVPLKSIFKISLNTELDLEVRPIIQILQENEETRFIEECIPDHFRYGDLVYIRELGILAELEPPGARQKKFMSPRRMTLKKSQVPVFLSEFEDVLRDDANLVDTSVRNLKIFNTFDRIEITPDALDRDWLWISMHYGSGDTSVSLADILQARQKGQRYIPTKEGWVDCLAPDFESFEPIIESLSERIEAPGGKSGRSVKLSRIELLRLQALQEKPWKLMPAEDRNTGILLERILDWRPPRKIPPPKGLKSELRPYQKLGVEWLSFLYENGLGGLLCDDMGLGKTHQAMALMLLIAGENKPGAPVLVVCPTSVLSHWEGKIRDYAPGLKATVFHGGQRNFKEAVKQSGVIITSYGVLRNDINKLKRLQCPLAVFDEIQQVKNPKTGAFKAAREIPARVKLGLTGTPIENNLVDLKALFDIILPGYFGSGRTSRKGSSSPSNRSPEGPNEAPFGNSYPRLP